MPADVGGGLEINDDHWFKLDALLLWMLLLLLRHTSG